MPGSMLVDGGVSTERDVAARARGAGVDGA